MYASLAQAFSNEIEPFALKGALVPHNQNRERQPYLQETQAASLMSEVLAKYEALAGVLPARVVVHKTSTYQPEEEQGFRSAAEAQISWDTMIAGWNVVFADDFRAGAGRLALGQRDDFDLFGGGDFHEADRAGRYVFRGRLKERHLLLFFFAL